MAAIRSMAERYERPAWVRRLNAMGDSVGGALDASPLHLVGRLLTKQELLRSLRTRLLLCRALDQRPGIADERIEAPVIVTGPARSGTSITFETALAGPDAAAP